MRMPAHHLVTHGVAVGMTGSGKTGLLVVTIEEALRARVPVLAIDVKGDLPNLLLAFPSFRAAEFEPFLGDSATDDSPDGDSVASASAATELAGKRARALTAWGISETDLAAFHASTHVRVVTPGSTAGESLHVLSSLERRSSRWDTQPEAARASLVAAVSLVLRLVGQDPDPARSRAHVLLSTLALRRLEVGRSAELGALVQDLMTTESEDAPLVGVLTLDEFMPERERRALAAALDTLLASPSFASWRQGQSLDVGEWMRPVGGRTPVTVLSVAHLDDAERALVLGIVLEETLAWVRTLQGSSRLRALVVFDEVYGFVPPHPQNPPTKRPLVALMKQARAFGVGVLLATQNPMDLDYRALGNAGVWCIGRLQTDADRARVIEAMSEGTGRKGAGALGELVKRLADQWFVVRDAHAKGGLVVMKPRWAMSWLRGPMTRSEIAMGCARRASASGRGIQATGSALGLKLHAEPM